MEVPWSSCKPSCCFLFFSRCVTAKRTWIESSTSRPCVSPSQAACAVSVSTFRFVRKLSFALSLQALLNRIADDPFVPTLRATVSDHLENSGPSSSAPTQRISPASVILDACDLIEASPISCACELLRSHEERNPTGKELNPQYPSVTGCTPKYDYWKEHNIIFLSLGRGLIHSFFPYPRLFRASRSSELWSSCLAVA